MKKCFFALFLLIITAFPSLADEFEVKSFKKVENDLSARKYQKKDSNDEFCALIRILTDLNGLKFDSNLGIVGNVEKKEGEYWIYVSPGEKQLQVRKDGFIPLYYVLPEKIDGLVVYQMTLTGKKTGEETAGITTGMILLQSVPEGAEVWIDNVYKGRSPFQAEMASGYYNYKLSKKYFYDKTGDFRVFIDSTNKVVVPLDPNFGSLNLSVVPADVPVRVSIDGIAYNVRPPATIDTLLSGKHTITLQTDLYEPVTRDFIVEDKKPTKLEIPLNPIFGNIEITAGSNDQIFIDGTLKGTGTYKDILMVGIHTIEIKRDKYYTDTRKIDMKAGVTEKLPVTLKPITGSLSVITTPPEADIIINNENKGKSPLIINDLIIGTYEITLKKEGYATVKATAEIKENQRTTVNENLKNFTEVRIVSIPSSAEMAINKKEEGTTPKTLTLPFGENTIRLTKNGYQPLEQKFTVTEQQREYSFNLLSDAKAMAKADFDKYKKHKNWWLGGTLAGAAAGGYFCYAANKSYNDYKEATTDAEKLHNRVETYDVIWPIAFGISGACAVFMIINASKQGKARQKMNISAVPVEGGGMVMVRWKLPHPLAPSPRRGRGTY